MEGSKLKNNPQYMEGYFIGRRMISIIDKTEYKTLEAAIEAKSGLIEHLKDKFDWTDLHKDVAYNHGLVNAWKEELERRGPTPKKEEITLEEINEYIMAMGVSVSLEHAEDMVKRYPDFKPKCDPEWTNERIVEEMLKKYE